MPGSVIVERVLIGVFGTLVLKGVQMLSEQQIALWLWRTFFVELWPLWGGIAILCLYISAKLLYRLTRVPETERARLDATSASWFKERQDDITRELRKCHVEIETIGSTNNAGFDTFCAQYDHRLLAVEEAVEGLRSRGDHSDEPST